MSEQPLTSVTQCYTGLTHIAYHATIHTSGNARKDGSYACYGKSKILDTKGGCRAFQGFRGNRKTLHQRRETQGNQIWGKYPHLRRGIARVSQKAANGRQISVSSLYACPVARPLPVSFQPPSNGLSCGYLDSYHTRHWATLQDTMMGSIEDGLPMYAIYTLSDPRDNTTHYVGISQEVERRYATHLLYSNSRETAKTLWIKELRACNMVPSLSIIEQVDTIEEARNSEQHWIRYYLELGMPLKNKQRRKWASDEPLEQRTNEPLAVTLVNQLDMPLTESLPADPREQELVSFLRAHKWTYRTKAVRKTGKRYIYAVRWTNTGNIERYIAPLSRLEELTEDFIMSKLQRTGNVAAAIGCIHLGGLTQPIA